ncbi:DUF7507 domain-containing protein [Streptomyces sp. 4N509B]|uniref:DUF7507 domain-containing protein n=1 Tax=Streptomyces sp. 4N509B TaxID=3457413 RepID=UPI003FD4075C
MLARSTTAAAPRPRPRPRPARSLRLAGGGLGLLSGFALLSTGLVAPLPAAAQPPPGPTVYVDEDFTDATAPDFLGYGSACLTGAPVAADDPGDGAHPLGGCPAPTEASGPVPPPGGEGYGYLQLTDARTDQAGAALYDTPIPAEEGLVVSFEQWQYGPTAVFNGERRPADGISFFLVDGDAELDAPGAFGGSLGYAQKNDPAEAVVPGVDQGYVGIGLDVLGNFFNDGEGRGSGCPADQRSPAGTAFPTISSTGPNMVTVRGPGDGLEGYCFLDATYTGEHSDATGWESSLPGELHGPTTEVSDDPAQAEQDLEVSKRTVTVRITPVPDPVLTVWIDFNDGQGAQQVLTTPAPEPVPETYAFGFAGSTGVWSNVHLIRNVVVSALTPALSIDKSVPDDISLPLQAGDAVPYTYTVTNTGNTDLTDVSVTDDRLGPITCPGTTLAPEESMTCAATVIVTEDDVARGDLTNIATATAVHDGQQVGPEQDQVSLPVGTPGGDITVDKVDAEEGEPLGGAVIELWRETNGRPGLQHSGDDADTLVDECTTGTDGRCVFEEQPQGTYYLRESRAPEGYVPSETVHGPFELTASGYTATLTNRPDKEHPGKDPDPCHCKDKDKGKGKGKGKGNGAGREGTREHHEWWLSLPAAGNTEADHQVPPRP